MTHVPIGELWRRPLTGLGCIGVGSKLGVRLSRSGLLGRRLVHVGHVLFSDLDVLVGIVIGDRGEGRRGVQTGLEFDGAGLDDFHLHRLRRLRKCHLAFGLHGCGQCRLF